MSEPVDFTRPRGWRALGDPPSQAPDAAPDRVDQPSAPTPPPPPPETPREPAKPRSVAVRVGLALAVTLLAFMALGIGSSLYRSASGSSPRPSPTAAPVPETLKSRWTVAAKNLGGAGFVPAADGTFEGSYVIDASVAWVVLTGDEDQRGVVVHGLDPTTGGQRWQRPLDDALCASTLLSDGLVCAAAVARDPATGMGVRWRVAVIDPATGTERRAVDIDGWLTLVHVRNDQVTLVEQRLPAPHAVVHGLGPDLATLWRLDLSGEPEHSGMFSDNRITNRTTHLPPGPSLDRPRIRSVAGGLLALWAGQSTAFIDTNAGRLVAMPRCSRLVDDGQRLWCNAGDRAVAYSYQLTKLYETGEGTRLMFPGRDPRGGDVTDPVFQQADGTAMKVDLTSGTTQGVLVQTRNGSAFGVVTSPIAAYVNGLTLLSDDQGTYALDARTGETRWYVAGMRTSSGVLGWNGGLMVGGSRIAMIDPSTGKQRVLYAMPSSYVVILGQALASVDSDRLTRMENP